MPKVSKLTATQGRDFGPAADQTDHLDDYTVNFISIKATHDLAALLKGLPDDACQCPHWGYVLAGTVRVNYVDRPSESYGPGDAFYMPPGHVPGAEAGTEFVQFSPTADLERTESAMMANAQAQA